MQQRYNLFLPGVAPDQWYRFATARPASLGLGVPRPWLPPHQGVFELLPGLVTATLGGTPFVLPLAASFWWG
eukprot:10317116-Ditylum_brightwellii.AAC.1